MKQRIVTFLLWILLSLSVNAQSIFLDSLIRSNTITFQYKEGFSGKGWDQLIDRIRQANYVLIGEDHFIQEIPVFTRAIVTSSSFDNYVAEIDPWMMKIFHDKITSLSALQLNAWIDSNYNGFSFFQKKPDFELLQELVQRKIRLLGTEQIALMSTSIIFQELVERGNINNRKIYTLLRDSSKVINDRFFKDQSQPFFMNTATFTNQMAKLNRSAMNAYEKDIIIALEKSQKIYSTGSHSERIRLMQHQLMNVYTTALKGKRSLFRFGANHSMKGESFLPVYDIGTTAHVLAQSEYKESYHLLVLPKSGTQAGFLTGENNIDLNDPLYKALQPLLKQASDHEWTFIPLDKVRKAITKSKYLIAESMLYKAIMGYDGIVVIPKSTAAPALR